ncbi:MAG: HindIII family type II restriction endonuclease [Christensenellales bacterium]|jgi:hypothetical protein
MFAGLISKLKEVANLGDFIRASRKLAEFVDGQDSDSFFDTLQQIGTIPESIHHDSSEEKLFSKASDVVLSRAFREVGLQSTVLSERADSADVIAESQIYGYTLVADAKAFRMSRTAKNQKDFKVTALSGWRKDNDYAVLCSPYFQYPNKSSQIYAQAILENICLLSWEHLLFMMRNGIKESEDVDLSQLWNYSSVYSETCTIANRKANFTENLDAEMIRITGLKTRRFHEYLSQQINILKKRGDTEKDYWINEIEKIKQYTREQAIEELIRAKKIGGKIVQIDSYIKGLKF